jgi:sorbitol-specific phosphotransferase system component IIC
VALAAGAAGMLALETRASSAVGVAISITTIPAAAYLGVAAGVGEAGKAWGALAVLAVNVFMLLVGGTLTLLVQRWLGQRAVGA